MKILENLEKYILYIVVAIFPVFVVLNSTSPVVVSKLELLFVVESVLLVLWAVKTFAKGSISFATGKFDLAVLLIAIAYALSAIFATPNKMEAFFIPGIATFVIVSAVLYFLLNQLGKNGKVGLTIALFTSGVLYSLSLFLTELGLFAKVPQLPALFKEPTFNTLGGVVPGLVFLIPLLFVGSGIILKEKDLVKKVFWGVASAVIVMASVILIMNALPGKVQSPKFPEVQTSWEVAVGVIAKSPIFGFGPGNYLSAFNQFRPVTYNKTDLWAVRFTTATDYYLTALTETGFVGLFALALLLISVYKFVRKGITLEKLAIVAFLLLFAVFPISPVLFVPLFVLLAINSGSEEKMVTLKTFAADSGSKFAPKIPSLTLGVLILAGVVAANYFGIKVMTAEVTFTKAITALSQNNAKDTYNLVSLAVNQNPKVDRYHASLAQVDMALAQSLASQKTVSDANKQTITQLVQQAINEGKATVILNPGRSGNWEVLAQIYRAIMPFAQGADNFAIQTYTQAVALDPTSPDLRISLGGVYYALGRFDDAISSFKLAVLAKPDFANAHYNLAIAYREKKDFDNAIAEINIVLTLVAKDSNDYTVAQGVLADLQKNKPAGSSDNLTAPQTKQTSTIKPPIQLPSDSTPPASP